MIWWYQNPKYKRQCLNWDTELVSVWKFSSCNYILIVGNIICSVQTKTSTKIIKWTRSKAHQPKHLQLKSLFLCWNYGLSHFNDEPDDDNDVWRWKLPRVGSPIYVEDVSIMLLLMITTDCAAVMILCIAECGAKHASTHGDDGLGCWVILACCMLHVIPVLLVESAY